MVERKRLLEKLFEVEREGKKYFFLSFYWLNLVRVRGFVMRGRIGNVKEWVWGKIGLELVYILVFNFGSSFKGRYYNFYIIVGEIKFWRY